MSKHWLAGCFKEMKNETIHLWTCTSLHLHLESGSLWPQTGWRYGELLRNELEHCWF